MQDTDRLSGSLVPFARRWHVIQELDLVRLLAGHDRRNALSDRLEACADTLPARPTAETARQLRRDAAELVESAEQDEDAFLQAMFARQLDDPLTIALLKRIHRQHATDLAYMHELMAALDPALPDQHALSAEALGYLLRCCFTSCRDGIAFQELAILVLAQHRLTPDAREMLVNRLARLPSA